MIRAALLALTLAAPAIAQTAPDQPKPEDITAATPAPAGPRDCALVEGPFRFCGTSPQFTLAPQADNADVTAYYVTPEAIQAVAIIETAGRADGLTIDALQAEALEILSVSAGIPAGDIPILGRASVTIDGQDHPNFVYFGNVDGVGIVYSNSIVLLDGAVAQFVTLDIGATTYTSRHRALHDRFVSNVQVSL